MHEKYDLKGSTYKRKASKHERNKSSPTLKDLDYMEMHPEGIMLEADTFTALNKTIERDCRVSELLQIQVYFKCKKFQWKYFCFFSIQSLPCSSV